MGDARQEHETRLAYCREVLLPIWEHGSVGNPALRHLLECRSADEDNHEERLRILIRTTRDLRSVGGRSLGVEAALLAASACLKAYVGVPEREWEESIKRAETADRDVRALRMG